MKNSSFDMHAKILHSGQYEIKKSLEIPIKYFDEDQTLQKGIKEYIQELNREIAELELQLQEKRRVSQEQADRIIEQAQDEAKKVLEDAEQHAFDRVQKSVQEKDSLIQQASEEGERIKHKATRDAEEIKNDAQRDAVKIKEQAKEDGFQDGHNQGLDSGQKEVSFAVERLHGIIAETVRERERILIHSEQQVINLVLTMVTKVVKKMTIEHQQVVIENVKASLELLRGAMTLFIRVSPYDFNYTQSFKEELVRMIESKAELKFIEDPTIEPGGVYIETDMGDVDATIRSQLEELESQMRFYMPVKVHKPEPKKNIQQESSEETVSQKDIPKSSFAQREEYQSTASVSPDINVNTENSSESIINNTTLDQPSNIVDNTSSSVSSNLESSSEESVDDIIIEPENQAIHSYQEEAHSLEESSEGNDDIIV